MERDDPWLSVITVVKDDLSGLERTVASLAPSTYDGIEWVVVDGSSDPESVQAMASGAGVPLTYAWRQPRGVYAAMNEAIAVARGEYCWLVNAGDAIAQGDVMSTLKEALRDRPLWLIGQVSFVDANGRRTTPAPFDYATERRHLFARGRFAPHQGTLVRAQWLRDTGGFSTDYLVAADYQVSLRLSLAADPVVVPTVIADFHTGGLSARRWGTAVGEFHRARVEVFRPSGGEAIREWALTGVGWCREAAGATLRRLRA